MISNEERRRVAKELLEAASTKGKRSGSMELMLSKVLGITKQDRGVFGQPVDVAATWRDVYRKLAELIEPQTTNGGMSQKQRDTIVTLKTLNSFQSISCTEAVNAMEAAFGVDGIHELLAKLISVLEGGTR